MKKIILAATIFTLISVSSYSKNNNKNNKANKNWGQSKDGFNEWLSRHPQFSKKDRKALEKAYKEQIKAERKLRDSFLKYEHEISTLPLYRDKNDPLKYFIEDMIYNKNRLENQNFSPELRRVYRDEIDVIADVARIFMNLR